MRRYAALLVVLSLSFAAFATAETPVFPSWVYPCPKASTPPKIDGKLDDPAYQAAPVAGGFIDYHNPTQYVKYNTTFRVVHHGPTLYFAVRCEEPELDKIPVADPKGRDALVAHGETVEVFIDPRHGHDDYYQWIAEINRNLYDAHRLDPSWDGNIQMATARGDGFWSVEMAIPLPQIGVKELTLWQVIGFRICRNRWIKSCKFWSSWSFGGFHDAATYDHLVICPEKAEIPQDVLAKLMPVFRWKNERKTGPVQIAGASGYGGASFVEMGRESAQRLTRRVQELNAAAEILQAQAKSAQERLQKLKSRVDTLDAGTYSVFELDVKALEAEIENIYWHAREQALLKTASAAKKH